MRVFPQTFFYFQEYSMESKRVLVVDDEPEVTFALEVFFLSKGYQMLTALDGLQAMRLLRQHPIDVVLLDMKMPGVNGLEVLKYIRSDCPATKVIVVTAYDIQFQELVERIGADGFLIKPFGIQSLTRTVEGVLSGRKMEAAPRPEPGPEQQGDFPKARLLFVEPSEYTYQLKKIFFSDPGKSEGTYEVVGAYSVEEALQRLQSFRPDILLVDVIMLGPNSDLVLRAMDSANRPKELIIHGSGLALSSASSGRIDGLNRLGVKIIQNESFTRAGLLRLNEVVRKTSVEHGLIQKGSARGPG